MCLGRLASVNWVGRKNIWFCSHWLEKFCFILQYSRQIFHLFCDKMQELGGTVIYRSPGKTDAYQPVDWGFRCLLKALSKD